MLALRRLVSLAVIGGWASLAGAQGLLVHVHPVPLPRPIVRPVPQPAPGSYRIDAIDVDARIEDQVARVQVSQTFANTGSSQMEVSFVFPLPYDGAVDELTLLVDGKEYAAKLLPADEARKLYEDIVRQSRDPALLEWMGSGLFKTSVFPVPAGAKRTVTMRYSQVCRQSQGMVDFLFPLRTARFTCEAPKKVTVDVSIESQQAIKSIYCASHNVTTTRQDEHRVRVSYEAQDEIPAADFRLFYDVSDKGLGASVVSYRPDKDEPGYFLLMASPELKPTRQELTKTVILVADTSGSMTGEKIDQTKAALKFVVEQLAVEDTFNIITYDSHVQSFAPELQDASDENRKEALGFIDALYAGGSTNIAGALERAFKLLADADRPTYIVFMTDGLPTTGETNEMKIAELVKPLNKVRARLITMGVGYDVNSRLLDRLAADNFGSSEYVRPDEDIERAVSAVYKRIGSPVLTDVELAAEFDESPSGPALQRLYPRGPFDLFAGDTAIVVGRYRATGAAKVTLTGKLRSESVVYDFPATFAEDSDDDTNAFVAKLWATRRVGEIIDELDLKGHNDELVKEVVAIATEHGILTQYTSFMADDSAQPQQLTENLRRAQDELHDSLSLADGEYGFNQRFAKRMYNSAGRDMPALGGALPATAAPLASGPANEPAVGERVVELKSQLAAGNAWYYDAKNNQTRVATNILQVGRKTFYQNGPQWVDASLTEDDVKNARRIKQFSDEYFELARRHGGYANRLLALDGNVVVRLGDEVVSWSP